MAKVTYKTIATFNDGEDGKTFTDTVYEGPNKAKADEALAYAEMSQNFAAGFVMTSTMYGG